jgi:hypothetical protein
MSDQIDVVDIYRIFHPTARQYTFFSAVHGAFSKIVHILGHKASINKFKKIRIIPSMTSDHNGIKLYLSNKRIPRKCSYTWRMNNTLLKHQWVTEVKKGRNPKVPKFQ